MQCFLFVSGYCQYWVFCLQALVFSFARRRALATAGKSLRSELVQGPLYFYIYFAAKCVCVCVCVCVYYQGR